MRQLAIAMVVLGGCKASELATPDAPIDSARLDAPPPDGAVSPTGPLPVFGFEAPNPTKTADFAAFTSQILPHIAGPGFTMKWNAVDNCSATAPCATDASYAWTTEDGSGIDDQINAYIHNANTDFDHGCNGQACKLVLIVWPTNDGGPINITTPSYVFSKPYATSLGAAPQDVMVCNNFLGGTVGGVAAPIAPAQGDTKPGGDAVWNVDGGSVLIGTGFKKDSTAFPTKNFSGFPVVYEKPFLTAYEGFIAAVIAHYSPTGSGSAIAPYISYIRFGVSEGGEGGIECATNGDLAYPDWQPSTAYPTGALIRPTQNNPSNATFISNGGGQTGTTAPAWCSGLYCNTGADNTLTLGWRNTGLVPNAGTDSNATWPGPQGQGEAAKFVYNGFLGQWPSAGDGAGYMTRLADFIAAQDSAIPIDISAHTGPPLNVNWNFADGEAIIAAEHGIGFGMQSLTIDDALSYSGTTAPTSRADWAESFNVFATSPIVRHLQMAKPGDNGADEAEAFAITGIAVDQNKVTVTCDDVAPSDCSELCTGKTADGSGTIYISGNANAALNTTWQNIDAPCNAHEVTFTAQNLADGSYAGGTIFASDYLPISIPFATARHATSLELHECTLDYAYGAHTAAACRGAAGPDTAYQAAIAGQ